MSDAPKFGEWLPIETAPKQFVSAHIGGNRYGPHILVARYGDVFRARWWDGNPIGETRFCNFLDDGGNAVRPTHWMHLPNAPK